MCVSYVPCAAFISTSITFFNKAVLASYGFRYVTNVCEAKTAGRENGTERTAVEEQETTADMLLVLSLTRRDTMIHCFSVPLLSFLLSHSDGQIS
jgi:hypothetical protein